MVENNEMLAMMEESFGNIKAGKIVSGTIVSTENSDVLVDIGYKSEGIISLSEFEEIPNIGSSIKVYIVQMEDHSGRIKLSKKVAEKEENFLSLIDAFENKTDVEGEIVKIINGGFFVEVKQCNAFLPGSLVELGKVKDYQKYLGEKMIFRIISIDKNKKSIIVSRKAHLIDKKKQEKIKIFEDLGTGSEVDGVVKGITDYGVFVDIGGIDGLLHISDISWRNISHPSDMFRVGDRIRVKILKLNKETGRISLGVKQLLPHPWENIDKKISQGDAVKGIVTRIASYGAFIEIEPGLNGFLHKSELSWTRNVSHPAQIVSEGQEIETIVLDIDMEEKKIFLGLKQMAINPWVTIGMKYKVGEKVKRKIKSITSFGLFLELDDDIDGLVHIADVSWTKRVENLKSIFHIDQEIEVVILDIDTTFYKISFGIKQLIDNPWESDEIMSVGTSLEGKIAKVVTNKGLVVDIVHQNVEYEGFVPISYIKLNGSKKLSDSYSENQSKELEVVRIDTKNCRIVLKLAGEDSQELKIEESKPKESLHAQLDELDLK